MNQATERIAAEIRAHYNSVSSTIVNRRDHPSYGYTKRYLYAQFDEMCGLLKAWLIVSGYWTGNGGVIFNSAMKRVIREFGIDLDTLASQVKES